MVNTVDECRYGISREWDQLEADEEEQNSEARAAPMLIIRAPRGLADRSLRA